MAKRGLGRGIDSLIQVTRDEPVSGQESGTQAVDGADVSGSRVASLPIESLVANPDQPRKEFNEDHLKELAESITQNGIIQPILVEPYGEAYRIIAGERRYRAAGIAGLEQVPAIIRTFSEEEKYEIALIENIQREDLTAIEEARAFKNLIDRFELSQEELARKLGKNRSTIANALRLLKLPDDIQESLNDGMMSAGHARALLSITQGDEAQIQMFRTILDHGLSVRDAEALAKVINQGVNPAHALTSLRNNGQPNEDGIVQESPEPEIDLMALTQGARFVKKEDPSSDTRRKNPELWDMEEHLIRHLGTKVQLKGSNTQGKIEISYYSQDDLERVFALISGVSE
ncbi:ParB/RepB/Spo0J family partition protein [Spirochaeta lutea]|uniref:ParB-like N-terminal domain-containing protein n=1 Tax=Spirochaeta lutea TaxID=1480694 RepID=A0A098QW55_9SPIO|nr:ParB/RepB/Spo0J family partition protein [Spirochaeta lutea]KGE71914.1 hypothetical protein DC28_08930 [Spirochaeta lutea]